MINAYFKQIDALYSEIKADERNQLELGAEYMAEAIRAGGIVQCFGTGHSHMIGEELFYRAGGLAPIKPIWIEELLLEKGGIRSSLYERSLSFAQTTAAELDIQKEDIMIITSNSGRNPAPIEVALAAKAAGVKVIALTSLAYSKSVSSRHPQEKKLYELADVILDTKTKAGDAVLSHREVSVPFAPTSTIIGMLLVNSLIARVIEKLAEANEEVPVFLSGNLDGSDEWNQSLIDRYEKRIPMLSGGEKLP